MTATALPLGAGFDLPARPLRITVVIPGTWPEPARVLGWAGGPDAWKIAATAREFFDATGRQPEGLPGWTPAGEC